MHYCFCGCVLSPHLGECVDYLHYIVKLYASSFVLVCLPLFPWGKLLAVLGRTFMLPRMCHVFVHERQSN